MQNKIMQNFSLLAQKKINNSLNITDFHVFPFFLLHGFIDCILQNDAPKLIIFNEE